MDRERIDATALDIESKLINVNRVAKVVKGGRNFRFAALVVVGDGKGKVGIGTGKATEIPEAIRKAEEQAKKSMITVSMDGNTIPHEINGRYGTGHVIMLPAPDGTGVIAGGPARAVLEMAGVKNIRTKSYGSNNPRNMVNAVMQGLGALRTAEQVARLRGKSVEEILG